jgi:hypothetical protein
MKAVRLPAAPLRYDPVDQDTVRRLVEQALTLSGVDLMVAANIPAPTGGSVQDVESRAAITAVLAILKARGYMREG